jgi:hypothetical protein
VIARFGATPATTSGASAPLSAVFADGTGSIDNGVGAVTSGSPVTVSPPTTYLRERVGRTDLVLTKGLLLIAWERETASIKRLREVKRRLRNSHGPTLDRTYGSLLLRFTMAEE